jgi:hypothetical protein
MVAEWIEKDPDHKGQDATWFAGYHKEGYGFEKEENQESVIIEDEVGPLFNCKIEHTLRLHIQFNMEEKSRTARGLGEAFKMLLEQIKGLGFKELIFESQSPSLINYCVKRMGFTESPNELKVRLDVRS